MESIEIPTFVTEIKPKGTRAVHGPQSTNLSNRELRYPDAMAMPTTSATPNRSNHLEVANSFKYFLISYSPL